MIINDLTEKISYIKNVNYYAEFVSISTFLQETKQKLITHSKPHPIRYKIADSIENTDRASYELYLDEYRKCREKQNQSLALEKLLNEIRPQGNGWDGTYNRNDLPATDYWFKVIFEENGKMVEFKSHFSLKR